MFTLLTPEQKKKVLLEYRMRLVTIFLASFLVLVITGLALLVPTYLEAKGKLSDANLRKQQLENLIKDKSDENLSKAIKDLKQNLVAASLEDRSLLGVMKEIIDVKPATLSIISLNYAYSLEGNSTIEISGIAPTRKTLTDFVRLLEKNSKFKQVNLPISNLAKDSEIDFELNITGPF